MGYTYVSVIRAPVLLDLLRKIGIEKQIRLNTSIIMLVGSIDRLGLFTYIIIDVLHNNSLIVFI